MLIFGSTFTLILLSIICFGAYKVWMGVTHVLSKTFFHQTEERHVKKISFAVVAVSVLLMAAPLIIPTALGFKEIVGGLYILYAGTAVWQFYSWFSVHFKGNTDTTDSSDKKSDKNGK